MENGEESKIDRGKKVALNGKDNIIPERKEKRGIV
jgi:hypothetical protein